MTPANKIQKQFKNPKMKHTSKGGSLDPFNDPVPGGKNAGDKLPRLALVETGWWFWCLNEGSLKRVFDAQKLQALFKLTTRIAIPAPADCSIVADYFSTSDDGLKIVKLRRADAEPECVTFETRATKSVLDIAHDYYAYRGCRAPVYDPVLEHVIDLYFGGSKGNVTVEAALQFFSTAANFASGELPQQTKTNLQLQ